MSSADSHSEKAANDVIMCENTRAKECQKVLAACEACRKNRKRCSGSYPCASCEKKGENCVFIVERRRRGPVKRTEDGDASRRVIISIRHTDTIVPEIAKTEPIRATRLSTGSLSTSSEQFRSFVTAAEGKKEASATVVSSTKRRRFSSLDGDEEDESSSIHSRLPPRGGPFPPSEEAPGSNTQGQSSRIKPSSGRSAIAFSNGHERQENDVNYPKSMTFAPTVHTDHHHMQYLSNYAGQAQQFFGNLPPPSGMYSGYSQIQQPSSVVLNQYGQPWSHPSNHITPHPYRDSSSGNSSFGTDSRSISRNAAADDIAFDEELLNIPGLQTIFSHLSESQSPNDPMFKLSGAHLRLIENFFRLKNVFCASFPLLDPQVFLSVLHTLYHAASRHQPSSADGKNTCSQNDGGDEGNGSGDSCCESRFCVNRFIRMSKSNSKLDEIVIPPSVPDSDASGIKTPVVAASAPLASEFEENTSTLSPLSTSTGSFVIDDHSQVHFADEDISPAPISSSRSSSANVHIFSETKLPTIPNLNPKYNPKLSVYSHVNSSSRMDSSTDDSDSHDEPTSLAPLAPSTQPSTTSSALREGDATASRAESKTFTRLHFLTEVTTLLHGDLSAPNASLGRRERVVDKTLTLEDGTVLPSLSQLPPLPTTPSSLSLELDPYDPHNSRDDEELESASIFANVHLAPCTCTGSSVTDSASSCASGGSDVFEGKSARPSSGSRILNLPDMVVNFDAALDSQPHGTPAIPSPSDVYAFRVLYFAVLASGALADSRVRLAWRLYALARLSLSLSSSHSVSRASSYLVPALMLLSTLHRSFFPHWSQSTQMLQIAHNLYKQTKDDVSSFVLANDDESFSARHGGLLLPLVEMQGVSNPMKCIMEGPPLPNSTSVYSFWRNARTKEERTRRLERTVAIVDYMCALVAPQVTPSSVPQEHLQILLALIEELFVIQEVETRIQKTPAHAFALGVQSLVQFRLGNLDAGFACLKKFLFSVVSSELPLHSGFIPVVVYRLKIMLRTLSSCMGLDRLYTHIVVDTMYDSNRVQELMTAMGLSPMSINFAMNSKYPMHAGTNMLNRNPSMNPVMNQFGVPLGMGLNYPKAGSVMGSNMMMNMQTASPNRPLPTVANNKVPSPMDASPFVGSTSSHAMGIRCAGSHCSTHRFSLPVDSPSAPSSSLFEGKSSVTNPNPSFSATKADNPVLVVDSFADAIYDDVVSSRSLDLHIMGENVPSVVPAALSEPQAQIPGTRPAHGLTINVNRTGHDYSDINSLKLPSSWGSTPSSMTSTFSSNNNTYQMLGNRPFDESNVEGYQLKLKIFSSGLSLPDYFRTDILDYLMLLNCVLMKSEMYYGGFDLYKASLDRVFVNPYSLNSGFQSPSSAYSPFPHMISPNSLSYTPVGPYRV